MTNKIFCDICENEINSLRCWLDPLNPGHMGVCCDCFDESKGMPKKLRGYSKLTLRKKFLSYRYKKKRSVFKFYIIWAFHNCIVHPLVGIFPFKIIFKLHEKSTSWLQNKD